MNKLSKPVYAHECRIGYILSFHDSYNNGLLYRVCGHSASKPNAIVVERVILDGNGTKERQLIDGREKVKVVFTG